jgi:hypothetical protein
MVVGQIGDVNDERIARRIGPFAIDVDIRRQ